MLAHFLSALDVRIKSLDFEIDERGKPILDEVRDRLANFPLVGSEHSTWNEAYRLERLLALIEPASRLLAELTRRTQEAIEEGVPQRDPIEGDARGREENPRGFGAAAEAEEATPSPPRACCCSTHWRRFTGRRSANSMAGRCKRRRPRARSMSALLTFFLFLAPYLYIYFHHVLPEKNDGPFLPFSWFPRLVRL